MNNTQRIAACLTAETIFDICERIMLDTELDVDEMEDDSLDIYSECRVRAANIPVPVADFVAVFNVARRGVAVSRRVRAFAERQRLDREANERAVLDSYSH